jgi:hypothetical protein
MSWHRGVTYVLALHRQFLGGQKEENGRGKKRSESQSGVGVMVRFRFW